MTGRAASPAAKPFSAASREAIRTLADARKHSQNHDLQAAESAYRQYLENVQAGHATEAMRAAAELGHIYFVSAQYPKAIQWLERALQQFQSIKQPSRQVMEDRSAICIVLADSYEILGQRDKAVALLHRAYALNQQNGVVDAANQLRVLARLAELGETSLTPGRDKPTMDSEVERMATILQRLPDSKYARDGLRSLADYQQITNHNDVAVETLKRLLSTAESRGDLEEILDARRQLAAAYGRINNVDEEIRILQKTRARLGRIDEEKKDPRNATRLFPPDSDSQTVEWQLYELGEVNRLLADALTRRGRPEDRAEIATSHAQARKNYNALIDTVKAKREGNKKILLNDLTLLSWLVNAAEQLLERPVRASDEVVLGTQLGEGETIEKAIHSHTNLLKQYHKALLREDPRIFREHTKLGSLYLRAGDIKRAHALLEPADAFWATFQPTDFEQLAQTRNLLGQCLLLEAGHVAEAQEKFGEAAQICAAHLPGNELQWWIRLNQGRAAARLGRYREALEHFNAVALAQPAVNDKLLGFALLYSGLLYKDLGQFDHAVQTCEQALGLLEQELGQQDQELLPCYLALAGLHIARRDPEKLAKVVATATAFCARLPAMDPSRLLVRHQEAMVHFLLGDPTHRETDEQTQEDAQERQIAREKWEVLLKELASGDQGQNQLIEARVLHYLARLDYLDWSAELANRNAQYRRGINPQTASEKAYVAAQEAYEKQITQYEKDYETFVARNKKFAQMQEGNDVRAKEWDELKKLGDSLNLAQRSRDLVTQSEALEAQLKELDSHRSQEQLARIDQLEDGRKRAQRAIELLAGINPGLRYMALCNYAQIVHAQRQSSPSENESSRAELLADAIAKLQQAANTAIRSRAEAIGDEKDRVEFFGQYQTAFDLLVHYCVEANDLSSALVAAEQARSLTLLDQLRSADAADANQESQSLEAENDDYIKGILQRWEASPKALLYYYVGRAGSYAFVCEGSRVPLKAIELKQSVKLGSHDFVGIATSADVRVEVDNLRDQVRDNKSPQRINEARQSMAQSSAVLLPAEVRQFLEQARDRLDYVTVIPHGSIMRFPLEALVLDEGEQVTYLADVCPPLAYAPSLAILDKLIDRPSHPEVRRLLTVGDPDYAQHGAAGGKKFARLPDSEMECDLIQKGFTRSFPANDSTRILTRDAATETRVREALRQPVTLLHMAVHGDLDEDATGLVARIVLALPEKPLPPPKDNDGFLDLSEIYTLENEGCELAVLSACETNIALLADMNKNTQADPSFSLANGFLASGARRVLASDWTVADDSSSALVSTFVNNVTEELAAGRPINYARLLANARNELRGPNPKKDAWATPYYWAPFVLIGPATDAQSSGPRAK